MKYIILYIYLLIPIIEIIPQQVEDPNGWAYFIELFFGIYGSPPQPNEYEFSLTNVRTVWSTNHNFTPPGFFINSEPSINTSIYPGTIENSEWFYWKGWNMCYSRDGVLPGPPPVPAPLYGYGLYKISTNASNEFFYLDYRDTRIPYYEEIHSGHPVDLWIKYDFSTNSFSYSIDGETGSFITINKGQYLPFWSIKQTIPSIPYTIEFQNYWSNCLTIIPSQSGNNPRLVWGPYPSGSITIQAYEVYRKVGSGNFNLIHTNSSTQFEYTDTDYIIPTSGGSQLQYYVKASFVPDGLSQPTNTVTTNGNITLKEKSDASTFVDENILHPNYPNPFNPTTKISYSIKEEGLVTLNVYDILGKEIASLVNENKLPGFYEANFDASQLPSGMYIYKLRAGSFVQTRKMLLMK